MDEELYLDKNVYSSSSGGSIDNNEMIELQPLVDQADHQYSSSSPIAINNNTYTNNSTQTATTSSHNDNNDSHGGHGGHYGPAGTATSKQVAVNIFISFVGCGMLGMPYAFSQSGWLLGILALSAASTANVYAMLLLVKTRKELEKMGHDGIFGYGDVGRVIMGRRGESFMNACLVISQVGFVTAYIIFIAANLKNIADVHRAVSCFSCIPILAILVQFQDMKKLSPFSLVADVANIIGLASVMFQDYESFMVYHEEDLKQFDFSNLLYVTGVSIYALEGVGLVLPLESSYVHRDHFPTLLRNCIIGITSLMAIFGLCGYVAFGSTTRTPITLNLEGFWATLVKLALCLALYLTFPMMMFPVNEVMEDFFLKKGPRPNRAFRTFVVFLSATVAYGVPDFGKFLSLVGSSICTILGFILPGYFHLKVFDKSRNSGSGSPISSSYRSDGKEGGMSGLELFLDYFLIVFGVLFGAFGTYDSFMGLLEDAELSSSSHGRMLLFLTKNTDT